jgi:hypothetical protein
MSRHPVATTTIVAWGIALVLAFGGRAANADVDPRLAARLDAPTASAVDEIVRTAAAHGLPTEPLVTRALEGASRRVPGPRIVTAVRNLASALETARRTLGDRSSAAELVAGTAALAAHIPPDTLSRLRSARGQGSLIVPLVVMTDLVTRNVPVETASAAVLAAARAHARDEDLMRLRQDVDEDIRSGATPDGATVARTRNLIGAFDPPPVPERGTRRMNP